MPSPQSADPDELNAVAGLLALSACGQPRQISQAYADALQRWPQNADLLLGYGNAAYACGNRLAAAAAFRRATEVRADSALAFNSLASVLSELGEFEAARQAAQSALALGGPWRDTALATLREIDARRRR